MFKTEVEKVYCQCGRAFDDHQSHQKHQVLVGPINKHNHPSSKFPPKPISSTGLMFTIWGYDRGCSSDAATVLIHAGHHVHLSLAISQEDTPIDAYIENGAYHRRLVLEQVFEALANAYKNGEQMNSSDTKEAEEMIMFYQPLEDENIENVAEAVHEWRRRHDA